MTTLRYRVDPRDAPASVAARVLGLTEAEFAAALPGLLSRGFPAVDETTFKYDLDAIERWRRRRHPHLYPEDAALTAPPAARDARAVVAERLKGAARG